MREIPPKSRISHGFTRQGGREYIGPDINIRAAAIARVVNIKKGIMSMTEKEKIEAMLIKASRHTQNMCMISQEAMINMRIAQAVESAIRDAFDVFEDVKK